MIKTIPTSVQIFTAGVACLLLSAQGASADIYKCTDSNNKVFYNDKPCRSQHTETILKSVKDPAPKSITVKSKHEKETKSSQAQSNEKKVNDSRPIKPTTSKSNSNKDVATKTEKRADKMNRLQKENNLRVRSIQETVFNRKKHDRKKLENLEKQFE